MKENDKLLHAFNQLVGLGPENYLLLPFFDERRLGKAGPLMNSKKVEHSTLRCEALIKIAHGILAFLKEAGISRYTSVAFAFHNDTAATVKKDSGIFWNHRAPSVFDGYQYPSKTLVLGFFKRPEKDSNDQGVLNVCRPGELTDVISKYPVSSLPADKNPVKNKKFKNDLLVDLSVTAPNMKKSFFPLEPVVRLGEQPDRWVQPRYYSLHTEEMSTLKTTLKRSDRRGFLPVFVTQHQVQ